jgi:hypothetical protein
MTMKTGYATTLTHGDAYAPGVEALGRSLRGFSRWRQPSIEEPKADPKRR